MADVAPISPMNIQLDPTISLKGVSAAPAGGGLGQMTMPNMLDMATRMNQLRLGNQEFGARRAAGQIIAGAPDLDTGVQRLAQDPNVVGFAAPVMNEIRQAQIALQTLQGLKATQSRDAFSGAMHGMLGAIENPHQLESLMQTQMALMPPDIQRATLPAMQGLLKSLNDQLPKDPAAAKAEYTRRMTALVLGSGVTPEAIRGMTGQLAPQLTTVKGPEGQEIPGIVGGPVAGGQGTGFRPLTMPGAPAGGAGGVTGTPIAGPTLSQAKTAEAVAAKAVDQEEEFNTNLRTLPTTFNTLNALANALTKFQAGGGAEMRGALGKALEGLRNVGIPISDEVINKVANNSLSDYQLFNTVIKPYMLGELKEVAEGTGRVMKSEVDTFMRMGGATTTPVALMEMLNLARRHLQIGYDRAKGYPQFKALIEKKDPSVAGLNPLNYNTWYADHYDESKLPTQMGTIYVGPRNPNEAMGVKKPRVYNHATGTLEDAP